MKIKIFDKTSLLNDQIYDVIEMTDKGYFILCHGDNCREFVLTEHSEVITEFEFKDIFSSYAKSSFFP